MSNLGEAQLLVFLKMLQEKELKYISLDEEDYKDGLEVINKFDVLIVPEYRASSLILLSAKKDGYRVYLNDEKSQERIAQYLQTVSRWNKKNFFREIVILLSLVLIFSIWIRLLQLA
ncbi:TPA: hypothetical protein ACG77T_002663 [Enterococcus faecium]